MTFELVLWAIIALWIVLYLGYFAYLIFQAARWNRNRRRSMRAIHKRIDELERQRAAMPVSQAHPDEKLLDDVRIYRGNIDAG